MLYGARVSIAIGGGAVLLAATLGVILGLLAGYFGGRVDALIMRIGDVILSFPTILLALLVSGIARAVFPGAATAEWAPVILICAIAIHEWVQYARTVRAATMVETAKDYVQAAKVIGLPPRRIMLRHILPNVMSPVLVIATINLAAAVLTEATLSFLGVGMPPTYPSLGTLIRIGNEFVFSGIWWIALFPALDPGDPCPRRQHRRRLAARSFQSQAEGETMNAQSTRRSRHRQPRVEYPLANGSVFTAVENASPDHPAGRDPCARRRVRRRQDDHRQRRDGAPRKARTHRRRQRSISTASGSTPRSGLGCGHRARPRRRRRSSRIR